MKLKQKVSEMGGDRKKVLNMGECLGDLIVCRLMFNVTFKSCSLRDFFHKFTVGLVLITRIIGNKCL